MPGGLFEVRNNETRTFEIWPVNSGWSFQVTRVIANADFGGGDFTEAYEAIQLMTPGDPESWYREWHRIGRVCEQRGLDCAEIGNGVSARSFLHRASQYFKFAGMYLAPFDERKIASQRRMVEAFTTANRWLANPLQRIAIPYEGHQLDGWYLPPAVAADDPGPAFVWVNGGDETPEENYFSVGKVMSEAGYGWLCFDQPGTGASLHEKRLPVPHDSERFVTPAVDYLAARPDVDADRIILAGMSFGGHTAGRAAAFEKRPAATILMPPVPDLGFHIADEAWRETFAGGQHLMGLIGVNTIEEVPDRLRLYDWNEHAGSIQMPLLSIGFADERIIPNSLAQTASVHEAASSAMKRLHFVERGGQLGGTEHCCADNRHVLHEVILNWLIEIGLAPKS